jgi:hypothetical protein
MICRPTIEYVAIVNANGAFAANSFESNVYARLKSIYRRAKQNVSQQIPHSQNTPLKSIYGFVITKSNQDMGVVCSTNSDLPPLSSLVESLSKDFVACYCEKDPTSTIPSMVLLQSFQKYVANNIDPIQYEEWTRTFSPYERLNFILNNAANIQYLPLSRDTVIGVRLKHENQLSLL